MGFIRPVRKETGMEKNKSQARGTTLNALREELYSLNRRMLLAIQNRDEGEQARIAGEIAVIQENIRRLGSREAFLGPA